MHDYAHEKTDEILEDLEETIARHYSDVFGTSSKKYAEAMQGFYKEKAKKENELENGHITADEYEVWLRKQSNSDRTKKAVNELANDAVKADSKAVDIINGALAGVFLINLRWAASDVKEQNGGVKVSTELLRHDSEKEIKEYYEQLKKKRESKKLWEKAELNMMKDKAWNKGHFYSVVKHGVEQGYSIDRMSDQLQKVFEMDTNAARRWARTTVTGVQNQARIEYALELIAKGYEVEKEWISTIDKRTRDSHRRMNHETQTVMSEFSNALMFPGDTFTNDPGEYINCRCRLNINILSTPEGNKDAG